MTKNAFIALVGAPNAGKSTLINQLVGQKVSIVTPKVQTTRFRIHGIQMLEGTQLVYIDTPGIFEPKGRLDKAMVSAAWSGASDADCIAVLVDSQKGICNNTAHIFKGLKGRGGPIVILLNKVDKIAKDRLILLAQQVQKESGVDDIFMISAKTGDGVDDLARHFATHARPGPWLYPEDQITDINERLYAAEITREQLFLRLKQELPYALIVETEKWETKKDGSLVVHQTIIVEREGHKKIILGAKGELIKTISTNARKGLEHNLGCTVHLYLFVKVRDKWKDKPEFYKMMGLEY